MLSVAVVSKPLVKLVEAVGGPVSFAVQVVLAVSAVNCES